MTLDERIKQALRKNSQWEGSAEALWAQIASQLEEKPKPKRQPLWLGTAAAAVLVMALVLQAVWSPHPPEPQLPQADKSAELRLFSTALPPIPREAVPGGGTVELVLEVHLTPAGTPSPPQLEIWQEGTEPALVIQEELDGAQLLREGVLIVQAPSEPGSYRLVVHGSVPGEGQLYAIYGEKLVEVAEPEN